MSVYSVGIIESSSLDCRNKFPNGTIFGNVCRTKRGFLGRAKQHASRGNFLKWKPQQESAFWLLVHTKLFN